MSAAFFRPIGGDTEEWVRIECTVFSTLPKEEGGEVHEASVLNSFSFTTAPFELSSEEEGGLMDLFIPTYLIRVGETDLPGAYRVIPIENDDGGVDVRIKPANAETERLLLEMTEKAKQRRERIKRAEERRGDDSKTQRKGV